MRQFLSHRMILSVWVAFALLASAGSAQADKLSGTISQTVTIKEDSELVGDVTCAVVNAPCIHFGKSDIKLMLNGFTITGRADPPKYCTSEKDFSPEDGIAVVALDHVAILGPGRVEKFVRVGILASGASKVRVHGVTTSDNCFSGILLVGTTDSDIEKNVSVRNAIGTSTFPCGGT